jgi:hypothetical protein
MIEFALQPPERSQRQPSICGLQRPAPPSLRRPGRTLSRHRPALDVGEPRSRAGADAAPEPGHSRGYTMKTFHNPSYANGTKREQLCEQRIMGRVPMGLARVGFPETGRFRNTIPLAVDEAQIIDMQGKLSANHGCHPQVGARAGAESAPTSRAHGRHRRTAPGAPAPRASPDRRGAAPSSGACGGAVGLGLDFGSRRDRAGCRPRMGAPTRGGHGNLIYNYFGGSP